MGNRNTFLENIFSVKNSTNQKHKVITILGLKTKLNKKYFKNKIQDFQLMHDKSLYVGIPENLTLQLSFNNDCNCKCKFCCEDIRYKKEEIEVMPARWLYEDLKELYPKTTHLVPTYGELTFKKEGYEYIKWINENYPTINVFIESNGIAFNDKWAQLASDNLMRINFSINAVDEEHFKQTVWDKDGVFTLVRNNVNHYIEVLKSKGLFAFKPSVSSVINSTNYDTIEQFIEYWTSRGIQNIVLFFDNIENEVFSENKTKDKKKAEEIVEKLLEIERIFEGKVDLGWQLFVPIDNVDELQKKVYERNFEEIKAKYPNLVEATKDFNLKKLFEEKTKLRKEHCKKEYTYYEEITNVTFHQKINGEYTMCTNPWNHLRLRPNGNFAVCSWVGYPENIHKYIEKGKINWKKVFNCAYYRKLRKNFAKGCYLGCMPNCPATLKITKKEFENKYCLEDKNATK